MNSGRILKRPQATLSVLAAFLVLAGCTVGRLSDRIVIDRTTRVTDASGNLIDLADKDEDFLHVSEVGQEGDWGLKLGPGAILTYVRWSPGFATIDKSPSPGLKHEPASEIYRIVLRKVEERTELRADEERFLSSVLTVHRQNWQSIGKIIISQLRPALYRSRKLLWNALVDELAVRRVGPGPAEGLELLPIFRIEALCAALRAQADRLPPGNEKETAVADLASFAKAFVPGGETSCDPGKGQILELTAMPMGTLKSVIHGAASTELSTDSGNFYYAQGNERSPYAQFNFATAELHGARVDRRDVPESDWTLREWEDSRICHVPGNSALKPVIRRVRLAGGVRPLWISRGGRDPKASYRLVSILTRNQNERRIERKSHAVLFEDQAVLDDSALDTLRMSDLRWIEWAIPGKQVDSPKARVLVEPSGCYFASER